MSEYDWEEITEIFNQDIIQQLENLGYPLNEAQSIFDRYKSIVERIDTDWFPEEWANELHQAVQDGFSPEQWHTQYDWVEEAIADIERAQAEKKKQPPTHRKIHFKRFLP